MADQNLAVAIIFNAVDNLGGTLKNIDSQFGDLGSKVEGFAQPFANFTDSLLKAETALAAVAAAMVALSIDKAGKFGDQIAEIGTLFKGTSEQMGLFSRNVLDYGQNSTQSLDKINAAVYSAVSAGVKYEDSIKLVGEAEKLAVAGRADLGEVTKVLTGTLNAYGASTGEAAKYSDALFTAVKIGQTTMPELSASLGQVTSIAATAGVPFEDLAAAIAVMTASGMGTSEAITSIKAGLSNIIKPSKDASDAANSLGVGFGVAELKSKSLDGILRELMQATGGNVDQMAKFFGSVEGLNGMMALGRDGAGKFSDAIGQMANSTGATQAAFSAMADNYALALQKMANAADVALIKLGKPLMDEFGGVANALAGIFKGLGAGFDQGAFDPIIGLLERFGQQATATLNTIGKNLPDALGKLDFTDLVRSLGDLADEMGGLFERIFGKIDLETPEGLAVALQKVIDIITGLVDVTRGIATQFEPLFDAMGELADRSGSAGEDAAVMAGQFLGAMKIVADFGLGLGGLVVALNDTKSSMVWSGLFDGLTGAFNTAQAAFDAFFTGIGVGLVAIVKGFDVITGGAWADTFADVISGLEHKTYEFAASAQTNAGEAVDAFGKIGTGMEDAVDPETDKIWNEAAESVKSLGINAGEAAVETAKFEPIDLGDLDPVAEAMKRLGISAAETADATEKMTEATQQVAPEWATAEDKARGYKVVMDELGNVTYQQVGGAITSVTDKVEDQSKKIEKAEEAAAKWQLEMEKLASNERIKLIEATVQLNIAELESQTEQVKAAFASIDNTVNSTGDLLGTLFGQLGQGLSNWDKSTIEDQIRTENKRRQEALDLQKKLVEAQVKYLEKRAEALGRGDAQITVQADGLKPALETIWYEIMREIQVKASEEGMELLLGALA